MFITQLSRFGKACYNHPLNIPMDQREDKRTTLFWKICNIADSYLSFHSGKIYYTNHRKTIDTVAAQQSKPKKYAKWGSYALFITALCFRTSYRQYAWGALGLLTLAKCMNRYHFHTPKQPPLLPKTPTKENKVLTDFIKKLQRISKAVPNKFRLANCLYEKRVEVSLLDLSLDFSYLDQLTTLESKYPKAAKQVTKDPQYTVIQTITNRVANGCNVPRITATENQEFQTKLQFIIGRIAQETDPSKQKELFEKLCFNFLDCQPIQMRFISALYREFTGGEGSLEAELTAMFETFKLQKLDQLIQKNHTDVLLANSSESNKQLPHITSKYLSELQQASIWIEGCDQTHLDHVFVNRSGRFGAIPYETDAPAQFKKAMIEAIPEFVQLVRNEMTSSQDLADKARKLFFQNEQFGYYKQELADANLYQNLNSPSEDQENFIKPYYSDAEIFLLLQEMNLIMIPSGSDNFA